MKLISKNLLLTLGVLLISQISRADVKLPAVFNSHMVLQQNTKARLWGNADANEQIKIMASWGEELNLTADGQGKWATEIQTPNGSHTPQQLIFKGDNEIFLNNILIGEVWLCSGQSNMQWSVRNSNNSYTEINKADYPSIRFFNVPLKMSWKPEDDVDAKWEVCTPETTANISAIGYFFGRKLLQDLDVPIGLILSSWGGSGAQAWIEKETASKEGHKDIVDWYDTHEQQMKDQRFDWVKSSAAWRSNQKEGEPMDYSSRPSRGKLPGDNHIPFALYNAMINPLKTFSIKGALWYQGESNVNRANQYRSLFPAMIKSWRNVWNQGDFPFYFVQIAPYHYNDYDGVKSAELRDAQLKTLDLVKNTGMVSVTDISPINDIHPRGKQEVSRRLAMLALHHDYNKLEGEYTSPLYNSHKINGRNVILSFDHAKELNVKGAELVGFTIAGKDQKFYPAKGEIVNGNQLKVSSDKVKKPVAVRYGWSNAAVMNLFNEIRLPLSSFKTDNWKDTTEGEVHLDYP
ncbi:MAG: sialate O-acetylesterase [Cyclobacteriaceae bacterium]|jgi:sialate O-acetylesterase